MTNFTIAAIDLDDTLLHSDGTVSPYTLAQLQAWQQAGHKVVIATGRPPRTIGASLPPDLQAVHWVCYNGAEIHLANQRIYANHIPTDDAQAIVAQLLDASPQPLVGLEIDGQLYLNRTARRNSPYLVADLQTLLQPAAKVLIFSENGAPLARLALEFPPTAQPLYSARYPHFIQILATDCNKAVALRHLVESWGATLADVVAFGDDTNDVEMVALSGHGVAVENAVEEVKAVADYVTATNNEDGVAVVLHALLTGEGMTG